MFPHAVCVCVCVCVCVHVFVCIYETKRMLPTKPVRLIIYTTTSYTLLIVSSVYFVNCRLVIRINKALFYVNSNHIIISSIVVVCKLSCFLL